MDNAEWQRQRYRDRIDRGLCHTCGKDRGPDGSPTACRGCMDTAAAKRRARVASGLCNSCGKIRGEGSTKSACGECAEKHRRDAVTRARERGCRACGLPLDKNATKYLCRKCADAKVTEIRERVQNGLCWRCAHPRGIDGTGTHCRNCADKNNRSAAARILRGYCNQCGNLREDGSTKKCCRGCSEKMAKASVARKKRLLEEGICKVCGRNLATTANGLGLCTKCYFKRAALCNLGKYGRGPELQRIWDAQGGICPYTGRQLVLGENASVDHILPKSRFPELENNADNVEWVDQQINEMKGSMTKEEFLAVLTDVVRRIELGGQIGRPTPPVNEPTG